MYPKTHFIIGLFFALFIFLIFPQIGIIGLSIIVLSTVLIDVDHYIYYVYKKRDFNLKKAFQWFVDNGEKYLSFSDSKKKNVCFGICFLHGIELILVFFVLFYFFKFPFLLFVSTGFVFHQFLDAIDLYKRNIHPNKVLSLTYSLIYARNKKLADEIE
jgi:hypothetical protein